MAKAPHYMSDALGRIRPAHEEFVDILYLAMLGRHADAPGMRGYTDLIAHKPDRETLIAIARSLFVSQEAADFREHLKHQ